MLRLRTVEGLSTSRLQKYLPEQTLHNFNAKVGSLATNELSDFISFDEDVLKLKPAKAFVVSNSVIS